VASTEPLSRNPRKMTNLTTSCRKQRLLEFYRKQTFGIETSSHYYISRPLNYLWSGHGKKKSSQMINQWEKTLPIEVKLFILKEIVTYFC
jgi:hypothetical protein